MAEGTEGSRSVTVKAQTEKLVDMTSRYSLKQENRSKLEKCLFHLKTQRLRNPASSLEFYQNKGVDTLLQLSCTLHKDSNEESTLLGLVWGTLANLCALDDEIKQKVVCSAIPDICDILINCPYPRVLNTVCRTLGNVAACGSLVESYSGSEIVIIRELTRILNSQKDSGCLQSVLRALRKLCSNCDLYEELRMTRAVTVVSNALSLEDNHISMAVLKTLVAFTSSCGNLVPELWTPDNTPLRVLVQFVAQRSVDITLQEMAISILCRCAHYINGKAALSRVAGIEALVDFLVQHGPQHSSLYLNVLDALCLCCRDVLGRQRMRDSNGLQLIIELVRCKEFESRHEDFFAALICYYFDEHTLRYMIRQLNLMKSLVYHLCLITEQLKRKHMPIYDNSKCQTLNEFERETDSDVLSIFGSDNEFLIDSNSDPTSVISSIAFDSTACASSSSPVSSLVDSSLPHIGSFEETMIMSSEASQDILNPLYNPSPPRMVTTGSNRSCDIDNSTLHDTAQFLEEKSFLQACSSMTTPTHPHKKIALDVNSSTPIPANFIDSLLSSPTPDSSVISTSPQLSIPWLGNNQDSLESKLLLLLSRLSHLHDCQPMLATSQTLLAILHYFLTADGSNCIQSFKILSRIFVNPHCFQDCLKNHAPSIIFKQIYLPELLQSVSVVSNNPPSPSSLSPDLCSRQRMCKELFDKLCHVAESPYGQGVVAHMLLRGNSTEVTAGTLALTLLQRSHVVCHRMLLSYNGLHNLMCLSQGTISSMISKSASPATGNEVSESLKDSAMIALLYLADQYHTQPIHKRQRCYSANCLSKGTDDFINTPPSKKPRFEASYDLPSLVYFNTSLFCRYQDTDHWPFDLRISVGSKTGPGGIHHFPVHRLLLVESSEVFAVMLGGLYQESQRSEVHLHELTPAVFSTVIHHVYGCNWSCKKGVEQVQALSQEYNPLDSVETLSCKLVEKVVESLFSIPEKQQAVHCLLLLECANRYYMPSLLSHCEDVLGPIVSEANLVPMFMFSNMHQSHRLSRRCIATLTSLRDAEKQCEMFQELLESSDASNCLTIIEDFFHV